MQEAVGDAITRTVGQPLVQARPIRQPRRPALAVAARPASGSVNCPEADCNGAQERAGASNDVRFRIVPSESTVKRQARPAE